jgi:hypothetical protein
LRGDPRPPDRRGRLRGRGVGNYSPPPVSFAGGRPFRPSSPFLTLLLCPKPGGQT